jgi:hypothetical protein
VLDDVVDALARDMVTLAAALRGGFAAEHSERPGLAHAEGEPARISLESLIERSAVA